MKLNIAFASLVASVALCSQSFGFDLLDRMLGGSGCGCEVKCCETSLSCCEADPSCGCDVVDPSCGCNAVDPSCGCNADPCCTTDPSCGVNGDPCCEDACGSSCGRKPLIQINLPKIKLLQLRRCKPACCEDPCCEDPCNVVDPSCGCNTDPSCGCEVTTSCCKPRRGLLDRIFARGSNCCETDCCDAGCEPTCGAAPCGCHSAPAAGEAPVEAAPMVDSAAFSAPIRTFAAR